MNILLSCLVPVAIIVLIYFGGASLPLPYAGGLVLIGIVLFSGFYQILWWFGVRNDGSLFLLSYAGLFAAAIFIGLMIRQAKK